MGRLKEEISDTRIKLILLLPTPSHHLPLQCVPTGRSAVSPGTGLAQSCFWAWQDLAGQTLTRPFHAHPRKCHLAGVNDYHSNGRVTCSQQEPRSLHLSASHFPCPLFISLQVNYSSCTTRRHTSTAQTLRNCTLSLLI